MTTRYWVSSLISAITLFGCPPVSIISAPVAAFTASPLTGEDPLTVTFQNLSQQGGDSNTLWFWDFGDGSNSEERNPAHIYTQTGVYSVTDGDEQCWYKHGNSSKSYLGTRPPQAGFSADNARGAAPRVVTFMDESVPGTSPIAEWQWDFGDGETSTIQNPTHTYTQLGSYDVQLTVTTADGSDMVSVENAVVVLNEMHTQVLLGSNALDGYQLYFNPHPGDTGEIGDAYYERAVNGDIFALPNNPAGDEELEFTNGVAVVALGEPVLYFGALYTHLYVGAQRFGRAGQFGHGAWGVR